MASINLSQIVGTLLTLVTFLCCLGCDGAKTQPDKNSPMVAPTLSEVPTKPATVEQKILKLSNGTQLRYTIRIPGEYLRSDPQPTPLVLALHYGGRVTPWYGRGIIDILVGPALADLRAIVIAPDSLKGGWNTDVNETAILELLRMVENEYSIDKTKTLITGFSMGGHGTFHFGGRHQDHFRAAIPIAARPSTTNEWKTPLYVIHSSADEVVPIGPTQKYCEELKESGADITFVKVDDIPHYQTPRFVEPLKDAIPWIRKKWEQ